MQFVHGNLPFGGVNNSGIGNSHGHFGFKAFSHERAVVQSSRVMLVRLFFSPYDATRLKVIKAALNSLKLPMP
jgi:aldehyde dehydrogenase (NAD+)